MNPTRPAPCVRTHVSGAIGSTPALRCCAQCKTPYRPKTRWQSFCSDRCRRRAHEDRKRTGVYYDVRSELAEIKAMLKSLIEIEGGR